MFFKVFAVLFVLQAGADAPQPTGQEFASKARFATAVECETALTSGEMADHNAELEKFVVAAGKKQGVDLSVQFECRKVDDGSI